MGRQLRIEYPNALYHVMAHGNGFQWIYKTKKHLELFKAILINIIKKYDVNLHAVVLMRNHYHILIETPKANLSKSIKKLNQDFAKMFNKISGRKGSVFFDRYKSILIEKEEYYLNVLRYICQNPVRIGIVSTCEEYEGSFLKWIKDREFKKYIYFEDIKAKFGDKNDWYNNFINWLDKEKEENPKINSKYKYLLGKNNWLEKIKLKISKKLKGQIKEKNKYIKIKVDYKKLETELLKKTQKEKLDILLYIKVKYNDSSMQEICKELKIKSTTAGWTRLSRFKKKLKEDEIQNQCVLEIEQKIMN